MYQNKIYLDDLNRTVNAIVKLDKLDNTSILVTGATGTIGSAIVDVLMMCNKIYNMDIHIYAAGRCLDNLKERFKNIKTDNLHYVLYRSLEGVQYNFQAEYIVHAAGNAYPAAFCNQPVETLIGNIQGTYSLLEYLRGNSGKRFLYISSGEVYGQGDRTPSPYREEYSGYVDILSGRSCYPMSKRAAENLCASYSKEYYLETVIVRPCHTFGPCITANDNRAHVQFMRNVLADKDVVLKSEGKQLRSYSYVLDSVAAILTVLIEGKCGEAYNISCENSTVSIAELAKMIAGCAGKKVIFENPNKSDIENRTPIENQILDNSKLKSLGWKEVFSIAEGVSHTLSILKGLN